MIMYVGFARERSLPSHDPPLLLFNHYSSPLAFDNHPIPPHQETKPFNPPPRIICMNTSEVFLIPCTHVSYISISSTCICVCIYVYISRIGSRHRPRHPSPLASAFSNSRSPRDLSIYTLYIYGTAPDWIWARREPHEKHLHWDFYFAGSRFQVGDIFFKSGVFAHNPQSTYDNTQRNPHIPERSEQI